jgi:hypothetical protein
MNRLTLCRTTLAAAAYAAATFALTAEGLAQDAKPAAKPAAGANAKPEAKPDVKQPEAAAAGAKPDATTDAKAPEAAGVKPEAAAEAKPGAKPEANPDAKAEGKEDANPDAKADEKDAEKEGEKAEGGAPKEKWYEKIDVSAFIDAYYSLNLNFPKPQQFGNLLTGPNEHVGFSIGQIGLNAVYEADPVGVTLNLRFGPLALAYAGYEPTGYGLEYIQQGYVTWKPSEKLTIDFGKFTTFAGAESLDTQDNFNYTRGVLHWLSQPTFHTGLRVTYAPTEALSVTGFAVNGWDRSVDNNAGKTFALLFTVTPNEQFEGYLGYIVGPEQDDTFKVTTPDGAEQTRSLGSANGRLSHLGDLILMYYPTDQLSLMFNVEAGFEEVLVDELSLNGDTKYVKWVGTTLAARYAFNNVFAAAGRFEYYRDPDGYTSDFVNAETGEPADVSIVSGTLTFEAIPSSHLIVRLDGRLDYADGEYFPKAAGYAPAGSADSGYSRFQPTITLGVVAKTN